MRVLRLDLGRAVGPVDLHPFVTVLRGLDQPSRHQLIEALRSIARGCEPGIGGLVEHQGLLVELTTGAAESLPPAGNADAVLDVDARTPDLALLVALRARLDQLDRQASIDAARAEEVRHQLDPSAVARLDELQSQLAALTGEDSQARRQAARQLHEALSAWRQLPTQVLVAEPWVQELSERWEDHRRRSAACDARRAVFDRRVETASRRLAEARVALSQAEALAVPVLLTPEEENRLGELATRPVGKARLRPGRGRSEEEQAEIDELLARVGQPTYSAYMMYRMAPTPAAEHAQAIEAARTAVEHAERELAAATAARDDDPELAQHRDRGEAIRARAAQHLGPVLPDDLAAALTGHGELQPNPEADAARFQLLQLAQVHGLEVGDDLDDDGLVERVEAWVSAAEHDPAQDAAVQRRAAEVRVLQQRAARHRRALDRIGDLEAEAAASRRQLEELAAELAAASRPRPMTAEDIVGAVRERAARAGGDDGVAPVPLVLAGDFSGLAPDELTTVLERLEAATDRLQLILVTECAEAARWADQAGLRRAMASALQPLAG